VAVTEWGTTPRARTVRTTLDQLAEVPVASPAVIVVGPVAALALVPPRPLAGWSVAVTRPAAQAGRLARALADAGARVVAAPAVAVVDPVDGGAALRAAAARLGDYQWVAATSANAVRRLLAEVPDARAFGAARLAAVGPATAAALAEGRLRADLVAAQSSGAALADDFPIAPDGGRVLFVKAEAARDSLPAGLAAKGWAVDEVVAYRTVPAPAPEGPVLEALSRADAVIFASPSAVAAWVGWRRTLGGPLPDPAEVVTVGPTTTTAAREAGLLVTAEAESPSDRALVEALVGRALARAGSEVGPDRPIGGPPPSGAPPPGTSASGPAPSSPA
jgi:uroporphyrinogen III methyltransferase/synthase